MKATNYEARAWLLRNRQRVESAKRQAEKSIRETGHTDFHIDFILEALCGPMGRVMP